MKRFICLIGSLVMLAGCTGLSAPEKSELPPYEVQSIEQTEDRAGYPTASADVIVFSDATDPLQDMANRILLDNSDYDILNVSFYLNSSSGELVGGRNAFTSPGVADDFSEDARSQALEGVCAEWDEEVLGPPPEEC